MYDRELGVHVDIPECPVCHRLLRITFERDDGKLFRIWQCGHRGCSGKKHEYGGVAYIPPLRSRKKAFAKKRYKEFHHDPRR